VPQSPNPSPKPTLQELDGEEQVRRAFWECRDAMRANDTTCEYRAGCDGNDKPVHLVLLARGEAAVELARLVDLWMDGKIQLKS